MAARSAVALPRTAGLVGLVALAACSVVFDPKDLGRGRSAGADGSAGGGDDAGPFEAATAATGPEAGANDGDERQPGSVVDATVDAQPEASALDAPADVDAGSPLGTSAADAMDAQDAAWPPDASEAGTLASGLVAYYPFDETSGMTAADLSGNARDATMRGATFVPGLRGGAAKMNGSGQYVSLPNGLVSGLVSFSVSTWVNFVTYTTWMRVFDFGTGTTNYVYLTRDWFTISVGGQPAERRTAIPAVSLGTWHHFAVTLAGGTSTVYVDGAQVALNSAVPVSPANLGSTTQNWLGRSEYAPNPFLNGVIDEFRIYDRVLTPAEVQQIYLMR